jgi:ribosome biogenesis protein MAK21
LLLFLSKKDGDRYYMALYRKLLHPELGCSAKLPQFLNLLFKSLKADVVDKRVKVGIHPEHRNLRPSQSVLDVLNAYTH